MRVRIALACLLGTVLTIADSPSLAEQRGSLPAAMPSDRAKAMFDDARVKRFISVVNAKEIGGSCSLPDPAKTQARIVSPPPPPSVPPDFASTLYQIDLPCPGSNGLSAVVLVAEFTGLAGPLNMTLSLQYTR
jgi:hypothetical protein